MPRLRQTTTAALHEPLCAATLEWVPGTDDALAHYMVRYGVWHLLALDRKDDAEARMLDLFYMAALADAFETVVTPLGYWRVVGLERARVGFEALGNGLTESGDESEMRVDAVSTMGSFLLGGSLYSACLPFRAWVFNVQLKRLGDEHPKTLKSQNQLADSYLRSGQIKHAERLLVEALKIGQRTLGNEHPYTLTTANGLGELYNNSGRGEAAAPIFLQTLTTRERVLGQNHPATAESMINYAPCLPYAEAETLYLRAIEILENELGRQHTHTRIAVQLLVSCYASHGGYHAAEELIRQAIKANRRVFGPAHHITIWSVEQLAKISSDIGNTTQAESCYRLALEQSQQSLGKEHRFTIQITNKFAAFLLHQNRKEEAEELYLDALEKSDSNGEIALKVNTRVAVAGIYLSQLRYEEAERLLLNALVDCERTKLGNGSHALCLVLLGDSHERQNRLGEAESFYLRALTKIRHPGALDKAGDGKIRILGALAGLYEKQERVEEAETYLCQVYEVSKQELGPAHPRPSYHLENLAEFYMLHERFAEAEKNYQRAHRIQLNSLGSHWPLSSVHYLAYFYISQDKPEEALQVVNQSIQAVEEQITAVIGSALSDPGKISRLKDQKRVLATRLSDSLRKKCMVQGQKHHKQKNHVDAKKCFQAALEFHEQSLEFGKEHGHEEQGDDRILRMCLGWLRLVHSAQGDYDQSEKVLRRLLEINERTHGAEHPDTIKTLTRLAYCCGELGRYNEAEPLYRRSLEASERTLGKDNKDTLNVLHDLADCYRLQGRYNEAEPLYLRAIETSERTLGEEKLGTLILVFKLAWCRLDANTTSPRPLFQRLTGGWTDPTDWKYHWVRLGIALCDVLDGQGFAAAEQVITELTELLGAEHDRVAKARQRVNDVRERQKGSE